MENPILVVNYKTESSDWLEACQIELRAGYGCQIYPQLLKYYVVVTNDKMKDSNYVFRTIVCKQMVQPSADENSTAFKKKDSFKKKESLKCE
ncbi:hypothetical protein NPIL_144501 [Nephila pilipes]|uniref:Uncharacterized protein n=1 Tax=Nephila pilipes TaxID=299642 RepID=A0A8X6P922_NEPPI|nr:hypothetical protein NPIL_144501 [Nephila pilipes]